MGDPARPGPQFLTRSALEGEGSWFPSPQPLIVGLLRRRYGDAVFRISCQNEVLQASYRHQGCD